MNDTKNIEKAKKELESYIEYLVNEEKSHYHPQFRYLVHISLEDILDAAFERCVNDIRKSLNTGDMQKLSELKKYAESMYDAYSRDWYDEDIEQMRSGYPFEAGLYKKLSEICTFAIEV